MTSPVEDPDAGASAGAPAAGEAIRDARDRDVASHSSVRRDACSRAVLLVVLVLALVPVAAAAWHAHAQHWLPVSDDAHIAGRAVDAAHGHPPALGAESTSLEAITGIRPIYHLGPVEFDVLGAAHLLGPGPTPLLVAVMLVDACAIAASLCAARALAGAAGVVVAGVALVALSRSLGVQVLGDVWNPYVPVVALVAAVLGAWAYAVRSWLPGIAIALVAGTWCAQSHVTHVAILLAGIVPLVAARLVLRRRGDRPALRVALRRAWRRPQRPAAWGVVVAAGLTVLLWLPPLVTEALHGGRNVRNLVRATLQGDHEPSNGWSFAVQVVQRVIAAPPPFGPHANRTALWVMPGGHRAWPLVSFGIVAVLCVAAAVHGLVRRDRLSACIGASLCGMVAAAVVLLDRSTFLSGAAVYQTRWLWSLASLLWIGLAAVVVGVARARLPVRAASADRRPLVRRRVAELGVGAVALGGLLALALPATVTWQLQPDLADEQHATRDVVRQVERRWPTSRPLAVEVPSNPNALATEAGVDVAANLLLDGYDVRLRSDSPAQRLQLGAHHDGGAGPLDRPLLALAAGRAPTDGVVVAEVRPLSTAERAELERLRRRLAGLIDGAHLRWTPFGTVLHYYAQPDAATLLQRNVLAQAAYEPQVAGHLPPQALIDRYRELVRRSDPRTAWTFVLLPSG